MSAPYYTKQDKGHQQDREEGKGGKKQERGTGIKEAASGRGVSFLKNPVQSKGQGISGSQSASMNIDAGRYEKMSE